jgi:hypothetical protein
MENNNIYPVNNNFYWINKIGRNCKNAELKQLGWIVVAISKKKCGWYMNPSEYNDYNESLEAFLTSIMNSKTLDIQKPNPRRWNTKSMWTSMGKLVPQLPTVITFSYDLSFRHVISHWKGIFENYTLCHQTPTMSIVLLWKTKKNIV